MGLFGNILGGALGSIGSAILLIKGIDGGEVGGALGSLASFEHGGAVGKKKRVILVHPNEYVLPANAMPTKALKAVVQKERRVEKEEKEAEVRSNIKYK